MRTLVQGLGGELMVAGVGALVGSAGRFALGAWLDEGRAEAPWSLGTAVTNVLGSALLGLLIGATESWGHVDRTTRLLLDTGLLGGFTTFSRWALDAVQLAAAPPGWRAAARTGAYLAVTVLGATLSLAVGLAAGAGLTGQTLP